jgi:hypothetical protein
MVVRGTLTEGEGSVQLTSLYYLFRLASFEIEHIIYFFTKHASLMRRSTAQSLGLQLVFPWW